jgi:hypothetical protein
VQRTANFAAVKYPESCAADGDCNRPARPGAARDHRWRSRRRSRTETVTNSRVMAGSVFQSVDVTPLARWFVWYAENSNFGVQAFSAA